LHIGDVVYPHTLIGYDFQTGEEITAGCTGRVEKVVFLGPDHTLVVAVRPEE